MPGNEATIRWPCGVHRGWTWQELVGHTRGSLPYLGFKELSFPQAGGHIEEWLESALPYYAQCIFLKVYVCSRTHICHVDLWMSEADGMSSSDFSATLFLRDKVSHWPETGPFSSMGWQVSLRSACLLAMVRPAAMCWHSWLFFFFFFTMSVEESLNSGLLAFLANILPTNHLFKSGKWHILTYDLSEPNTETLIASSFPKKRLMWLEHFPDELNLHLRTPYSSLQNLQGGISAWKSPLHIVEVISVEDAFCLSGIAMQVSIYYPSKDPSLWIGQNTE